MNRYFIQLRESKGYLYNKVIRFTLTAEDLNDLDTKFRELGWDQFEIEILAWEKIEDIK